MTTDEELQQEAIEFDQQRNQLNMLAAQKQQLSIQRTSIQQAIEALEETKEKKVLKNVGPILIAAETSMVKKELSERLESLDLRIKTVSAQEQAATNKMNKLRSTIEGELKKRSPGTVVGAKNE